jgi:aryl-alcohol dehydrogenase-like predicted oxidoreductase
MLSGKYTLNTQFDKNDHRNFNRNGEAFDKGETFAGVNYKTGLEAVEKLKMLFAGQDNFAPIALKWILQHEQVGCIIPGASSSSQLQSNLSAMKVAPFTDAQLSGINEIYNTMIKPSVHQLW